MTIEKKKIYVEHNGRQYIRYEIHPRSGAVVMWYLLPENFDERYDGFAMSKLDTPKALEMENIYKRLPVYIGVAKNENNA